MRLVCGPIVRRVTQTTATIWLELSNDAVVGARARMSEAPKGKLRPEWIRSDVQRTASVGNRFYVILTFEKLQPGTAYYYRFYTKTTDGSRELIDVQRFHYDWVPGVDGGGGFEGTQADIPELFSPPADMKTFAVRHGFPEFRTLPAPGQEELRVAFGSCRKRDAGYQNKVADKGADVLKSFAKSLQARASKRLTEWPHLLLMLGDQIYADDVDRAVVKATGMKARALPSLAKPAQLATAGAVAGTDGYHCSVYEHFAASYAHAWTDPDVARLLANMPVFMTFDDHEIADDWNITSSWLAQALKDRKWTDAITEGLVAYWMYQGWGNPLPSAGDADPRVRILADSARTGDDVLGDLNGIIKPQPGHHDYYYKVPSDPPVVVIDARHDRKFVPPPAGYFSPHVNVADEILGEQQWKWLATQLQADGPVIVASSVPLLQFPYGDLGFLQLARPEDDSLLKDVVADKAHKLEATARELDADAWTAFPTSFFRLSKLLAKGGPYVFLSGDVHYSYAAFGRIEFPKTKDFGAQPLLLHAVSSPFRNQWSGEQTKANVKQSLFVPDPSTKALEDTKKRLSALGASYSPGVHSGLFTLRVFYPNPVSAFNKTASSGHSDDYTYLNNIAVLELAKDRKTASVSWYGAGQKAAVPIELIGRFTTPKGSLVR